LKHEGIIKRENEQLEPFGSIDKMEILPRQKDRLDRIRAPEMLTLLHWNIFEELVHVMMEALCGGEILMELHADPHGFFQSGCFCFRVFNSPICLNQYGKWRQECHERTTASIGSSYRIMEGLSQNQPGSEQLIHSFSLTSCRIEGKRYTSGKPIG
jgi:hypothetical protein